MKMFVMECYVRVKVQADTKNSRNELLKGLAEHGVLSFNELVQVWLDKNIYISVYICV